MIPLSNHLLKQTIHKTAPLAGCRCCLHGEGRQPDAGPALSIIEKRTYSANAVAAESS